MDRYCRRWVGRRWVLLQKKAVVVVVWVLRSSIKQSLICRLVIRLEVVSLFACLSVCSMVFGQPVLACLGLCYSAALSHSPEVVVVVVVVIVVVYEATGGGIVVVEYRCTDTYRCMRVVMRMLFNIHVLLDCIVHFLVRTAQPYCKFKSIKPPVSVGVDCPQTTCRLV